MTLREYLIGMLISTALCWFSWALIIVYIDPEKTNFLGFLSFYISFFFALIGTFTLVGFYLRVRFSRNEVLFAHVSPSFRQAILLSIILIGCLLLQSLEILTWWDGGLFVASVGLLEFYFMSRRQNI